MRKAHRFPFPALPSVALAKEGYRSSGTRQAANKSVRRKKRIMVFGTFDLLHPGHEFFIREAARRGSLTVVVAQDENVQRIKGRRPIEPQQVRFRAIHKRFPGTTVLLGDRRDFLRSLREVKPDLILLGYDQTLPPGIKEDNLHCTIGRIRAFRPHQFKSSLSHLPGKR